jgi:elongation factor 1-beta
MPEVRIPGAVNVGDVAIILKIMPESPEVDREALKAAINDAVPVKDLKEEPIGFGLVALKAVVVVPDKEGAPDEVEKSLRELDGVGSAEIIELTLM